MVDIALLVLRLVTGALLIGHGSQKLVGWFNGPGIAGTGRWLGSLGLRPPRMWAVMAGLAEFGGGLLLALGLFNPIGPIGVVAAMAMATFKAHWGKPIWVTSGGAELPLTNIAVAVAVALAGPGAYSVDAAAGITVPSIVTAIVAIVAALSIVIGVAMRPSSEAGARREERVA